MLALLVTLLLGAQTVTLDDVQQIQNRMDAVSTDIEQLRARDSARAVELQRDLDQVRDDVGYLRVRLRRNEIVTRSDYDDVRDRLEAIRDRAAPDSPRASAGDEIAVGTEFEVRLQTSLSSDTARVEDRFDATVVAPLARLVLP